MLMWSHIKYTYIFTNKNELDINLFKTDYANIYAANIW